MTVVGKDELYRQVSFIGYYFHWPQEDILKMSHLERNRFCEEISRMNREVNGEKNLFQT